MYCAEIFRGCRSKSSPSQPPGVPLNYFAPLHFPALYSPYVPLSECLQGGPRSLRLYRAGKEVSWASAIEPCHQQLESDGESAVNFIRVP
jgi:hypothetical protein